LFGSPRRHIAQFRQYRVPTLQQQITFGWVVDLPGVGRHLLHPGARLFQVALGQHGLRHGEIVVGPLHHSGLSLLGEHDFLYPPQRIARLGGIRESRHPAHDQCHSRGSAGDRTQQPEPAAGVRTDSRLSGAYLLIHRGDHRVEIR